ncbi:aminoglycoside phosphotransferase family protein [Citrobacter freundii]|uniref:aminoglycoside phosphotransferase family protein n=1 Tax=Citrobacter freundii TaxID=546 RepID=UPI00177F1AA8|nr:aminoglycoside phosphotransferase family protein [Citrobacter freundii]MBD9988520.1 APH(6) family putative aminoglycoside O-phosphotransferase [Citrobacter freundii]MBE0055378.1 APH(6) family putative aminoglycoside O-phosphotransferase [Citrobacter freundii]HBU6167743.1 APH(6) family putative aminoglycoside O-phosphotransferase [Citrobacter freundii]HBV8021521.1 APH(6) family putative aminoglycoside O-phosphotransferase [Citrobacter freundii]HEG1871313.1 APH(6) family putative aminoglycosi
MENRLFNTWLNRWGLTPDGEPVETHTSQLLPVVVIRDGQKAILKITDDDSERIGCELMVWWNGNGAAKVLAHAAGAILLERATGTRSLADMSWAGNDAQACRIICHAASRLHFSRNASTPALTPLHHWFSELAPVAKKHGGILTRCAAVANVLLSSPHDEVVLHGDLHHGNILDFGTRGWLAIDPKGLLGERGFDYANIFTNPDLAEPSRPVAIEPERFTQRVNIVSEIARIERQRLLMWIVAWCGLSSVWFLQEGDSATIPLRVAELAMTELASGDNQL